MHAYKYDRNDWTRNIVLSLKNQFPELRWIDDAEIVRRYDQWLQNGTVKDSQEDLLEFLKNEGKHD